MALHAKLSEVTEGWSKWDIALYVGAPIALGLAGIWLYSRAKKAPDGGKVDNNQNAEKLDDSTAGKTEQESEPQTPLEKAQAAKNKGNKLFKAGRYEQAVDCYTQAIQICPPEHTAELATFHQNRAAAYGNLDKQDEVLVDTTEALRLNPRYVKAMTRRARVYETKGRFREALADVTAACILEEFKNMQSLELADRVLKDLGRQHARQAYSIRDPVLPSKFYVKNYLSGFTADPILQVSKHSKTGAAPSAGSAKPTDHGDANAASTDQVELQLLTEEEATEEEKGELQEGELQEGDAGTVPAVNGNADPEEVSPYGRAVREVEAGSYQQVVALCTAELEAADSKHRHEATLLRGTFLILQGLGDQAQTDLQSLATNADAPPQLRSNAYIKLGSLQAQKSDTKAAMDCFNKAAEIDPENPDIYYHRGQQYLLGELWDDAIKDFSRSCKLEPKFGSPAVQKLYSEHRKALAYKDVLGVQRLVKDWEEILKQFPDYSDAFLLCAQSKCDLGMFEEGEKLFQTALRLEPDNPNILVHQGLLRMQAGKDVEEAVQLVELAIQKDPQCEYAYEVLGTIEVQRGNMPRAKELFDKAIHLCRSESEMAHLYSMLDAAEVQLEVAQKLGVTMPPMAAQ